MVEAQVKLNMKNCLEALLRANTLKLSMIALLAC